MKIRGHKRFCGWASKVILSRFTWKGFHTFQTTFQLCIFCSTQSSKTSFPNMGRRMSNILGTFMKEPNNLYHGCISCVPNCAPIWSHMSHWNPYVGEIMVKFQASTHVGPPSDVCSFINSRKKCSYTLAIGIINHSEMGVAPTSQPGASLPQRSRF